MAEAFRLLVPVPFPLVVVATAVVILLLEVFVSYERYSLILRWLALSIFAYVFELFVVNVDWSQVVAGLIPSFQPTLASIEALVAIFGTTISPYLFVWQAGEEVEERKAHRVGRIDARQIRAMRVDARALEPIAGRFASLLFAAGIVGTGLLAIPILAGSAAYALSETSGWREGLGRNPSTGAELLRRDRRVDRRGSRPQLRRDRSDPRPVRLRDLERARRAAADPADAHPVQLVEHQARGRVAVRRVAGVPLVVMTASGLVYLIGSIVG